MADSKFKTRIKAQAGIQLPAETINRVPVVDGSGDLKSSSVTSTELSYLSGVTSPIQTQITNTSNGLSDHLNDTTDAHDASAISNIPSGNLAATDVQAALNELQSDIDTRALDSVVIKKDGSVAFTAAQSMGGNKLTSVANGTAASDAVNRGQLDAALEGLKPKAAVRVATTANITIATALNSGDVIDGVTLANGDRVLVKDQTAPEQNGIYVVSATPTRSTDFDSLSPIDEINGSLVAVQEGTSNAGKVFVQSGTVAVLDTDPINFVFFNSSASLVGGDGITVSGSNISVDHDGEGLTFVATQLALELDGTTLSKSAAGLKVNSITSAEVSDFTEAAQDAVAAALLDSSKIDFQYSDVGNTISATIVAGSLSNVDINANAAIALTKLAAVTNPNRALQSDASGFIQASPVTSTELGYVSGVTSSIQTQLDGKASTTLNNLGTTSINANLLPSGAGARNLGSNALPWGDTTTNNLNVTQVNLFNSIGGSGKGQLDTTTTRTLSSGDSSQFTIWSPNNAGVNLGLQGGDPASGVTGSVFVTTGNASVNNNSGSIKLYTGTVSGTGVRGSIQFVDASLASASVGYIWTLQNTSTGAGAWAVAPAGYTDEQAQDAVGNILTDSATIDFTYNDAGNTITAIVIDGSITNAKVASGIDAVKIADGSVSNAEFQRLDGVTSPIQTQLDGKVNAQAGDIALTSFSAANNQTSAADVTGLAFANGSVRSFKALVSVTLDASSDLFEAFELIGVQKGASWDLSQSAVGDDSGVIFSITNAGQIQYTSANSSGFVSLTMKFRAIVTTV